MKPAVYVETSVVSYLTARPSRDIVVLEHQEITRQWWEWARDRFHLVVSELVDREAKIGDPEAAKNSLKVIEGLSRLEQTRACEEAAEHYSRELPLPDNAALHLAIASVHAADHLVSWGFAHVANALNRRGLARTNELLGLSTPIIATPEQMQAETDIIDDPIVREVRETRRKLFEQSGGTLESFFEMLRKRQAEEKRPVYRKPPLPSQETKST